MKELILNFTQYCNSKCTTCDIWKIKSPKVLSLDRIENILKNERLNGLKNIYLTGGEPFATDYCVKIAEIIKIYHPNARVSGATNSLDPEKYLERILKIKDLGLCISPSVSFNGAEETNDKSRGVSGHYRKALWMCEQLKANGIGFDIAFLENEETKGEREFIEELARSFGTYVGVTKQREDKRYNTQDSNKALYKDFTCPALKNIICIYPDGEIYPCERTIEELRLGKDMERWDEVNEYIENRKCQPCDVECFYNKKL
jgi:MoaA/NifB/PqqE/SkfB family radical SAM enzyme